MMCDGQGRGKVRRTMDNVAKPVLRCESLSSDGALAVAPGADMNADFRRPRRRGRRRYITGMPPPTCGRDEDVASTRRGGFAIGSFAWVQFRELHSEEAPAVSRISRKCAHKMTPGGRRGRLVAKRANRRGGKWYNAG